MFLLQTCTFITTHSHHTLLPFAATEPGHLLGSQAAVSSYQSEKFKGKQRGTEIKPVNLLTFIITTVSGTLQCERATAA